MALLVEPTRSGATVWDRPSDGSLDDGVLGAAGVPAAEAAGATEARPLHCSRGRREGTESTTGPGFSTRPLGVLSDSFTGLLGGRQRLSGDDPRHLNRWAIFNRAREQSNRTNR